MLHDVALIKAKKQIKNSSAYKSRKVQINRAIKLGFGDKEVKLVKSIFGSV